MILRYEQGMTTHHEPIDHPLTEAAAVEMWDASPCPEGYEFRGMLTVEQDATLYAMRAAFDAGREHERTTTPAEPLARTLLAVAAACAVLLLGGVSAIVHSAEIAAVLSEPLPLPS